MELQPLNSSPLFFSLQLNIQFATEYDCAHEVVVMGGNTFSCSQALETDDALSSSPSTKMQKWWLCLPAGAELLFWPGKDRGSVLACSTSDLYLPGKWYTRDDDKDENDLLTP